MNATLLFLVRKNPSGEITDICLAMKKRGFGAGRWNGVGGKVVPPETIEAAMLRETTEEIGVTPTAFEKVGIIDFFFSHKPEWNQQGHIYISESWSGEPSESEEMAPQWFKVSDIPYSHMWSDDSYWLPKVLEGKKIRASFTFGEGDETLEHEMKIVENI